MAKQIVTDLELGGNKIKNAVIEGYTPDTRTINGKPLSSDVSLTAEDLSLNYGASFTLDLNQADYKMTLTLKDQVGNTLTTKTIDFPIESVVVGATYDDANKKVILTLQNGTTLDVPIGALISGLQTEITETNKLNADFVNDTNSINKFVTAEEKTQIISNKNAIISVQQRVTNKRKIVTNPVLTPVNGVVTWNVTHTFGTKNIIAIMRGTSSGKEYVVDTTSVSNTEFKIEFNSSETVAEGTYTLILEGIA